MHAWMISWRSSRFTEDVMLQSYVKTASSVGRGEGVRLLTIRCSCC